MKKAILGLFVLTVLAALIFPLLSSNLPAQQREAQKLKVFISVDKIGRAHV
jgi:hypothetical protein